MAFTNRLIKKLPDVGGRSESEAEQDIESGAEQGIERTTEDGAPGYSITADTFSYFELNGDIDLIANTRIEAKRPNPTEKDYKKGWYLRYFVKRYDKKPVEVDKKTLGKFKEKSEASPGLYSTGAIKWHLSTSKTELLLDLSNDSVMMKVKSMEVGQMKDDIGKLNERYTMISDKICPGILEAINGNYTEFTVANSTDTVKNNLYTSGDEYKKPNGQNFIGYYHIHSTQGPMVGATHIPETHDKLIPVQSVQANNTSATKTATQQNVRSNVTSIQSSNSPSY